MKGARFTKRQYRVLLDACDSHEQDLLDQRDTAEIRSDLRALQGARTKLIRTHLEETPHD